MTQTRHALRRSITRRRKLESARIGAEAIDESLAIGLSKDTRRQELRILFQEARAKQDVAPRLREYLEKIEPYLATVICAGPIHKIRVLMAYGHQEPDPAKRSIQTKRRNANKQKFYASLNAYNAMAAARPLKPPGANR